MHQHPYQQALVVQSWFWRAIALQSWKTVVEARDHLDIDVDRRVGDYQVRITWRGRHVAHFLVYGNTEMEITKLLEKNMSVVAGIWHARLEAHWPKRISNVRVERSEEDKKLHFVVTFLNGHYITATEDEMDTEEFRAHGCMVHDLPSL